MAIQRPAPTVESILTASRELLDRDPGASLADVAAAAGVSRATVYRLFGSRRELLNQLDLEPRPGTRERILAAALNLVSRDGLTNLSMDEVAVAAGVSRASLYRLFPGKPVLFREVFRAYSPLEAVGAVLERLGDRPPDDVMPMIAQAMARSLGGRPGIARALAVGITSASDDSSEAVGYLASRGVEKVSSYVRDQMAAGRLRRMNPLIALQTFMGPLLLHFITRPLAERELGLDVPGETVAAEFAAAWLRSMRPDEQRR